MPTYEYLCNKCNFQFEEFQSITAEPLEECPKCKGPVRRLISPGNGLIFRGSGFYITDYKKSNNRSDKKSPEPEKKSPESKKASDKDS